MTVRPMFDSSIPPIKHLRWCFWHSSCNCFALTMPPTFVGLILSISPAFVLIIFCKSSRFETASSKQIGIFILCCNWADFSHWSFLNGCSIKSTIFSPKYPCHSRRWKKFCPEKNFFLHFCYLFCHKIFFDRLFICSRNNISNYHLKPA